MKFSVNFRWLPLFVFVLTCSVHAQGLSGSWSTLSSSGFTPRSSPFSVVLNGKLYVIDGDTVINYQQSRTGVPMNVMEVYDPSSNSWSPASIEGKFPTFNGDGSADTLGGKIYVADAYQYAEGDVRMLQVFDPSSNTWSVVNTPKSFCVRDIPTIRTIGSKLYVFGGIGSYGLVDTIDVFDPATNTFSTIVPETSFQPRTGYTVSVVDGKVYMIGGDGIADIDVFDTATGSWSQLQPDGDYTPRYTPTSTVLDGKIYVIGGEGEVGKEYFNLVEVYDPKTNSWSTPDVSGTAIGRAYATSAMVSGKIYVMGGSYRLGDGVTDTTLNTNELFTPSKSKVSERDEQPELRVWPNPATDRVVFDSLPQASDISIVNLLGAAVRQFRNNAASQVQCDLMGLMPGMYSAVVTTASFTKHIKVVVQ